MNDDCPEYVICPYCNNRLNMNIRYGKCLDKCKCGYIERHENNIANYFIINHKPLIVSRFHFNEPHFYTSKVEKEYITALSYFVGNLFQKLDYLLHEDNMAFNHEEIDRVIKLQALK